MGRPMGMRNPRVTPSPYPITPTPTPKPEDPKPEESLPPAAPTRRTVRTPREIQMSESAAGLSRDILFGRTQQGMKLIYAKSFNSDTVLYLVAAIGEGPLRRIIPRIEGTRMSYVVGSPSEINPQGARYTDSTGYAMAWVYDGSQTGFLENPSFPTGSGLRAQDSTWNTNPSYNNLAFAVIRLVYEPERMNSIPKITFEVEGYRDLFDPRTGTRVYSENPALVIREVMTNTRWGLKIPAASIDDPSFSWAANECDVAVFPAQPLTAPAVTADGTTGNLNGSYYFRVTLVGGSGVESLPTPSSSLVTLAAKNARVTLPIGNPTTTARKIYRAVATTNPVYRLVGTVANNTSVDFVDSMTHATWTAQPQMPGAAPLTAARYAIGINVGRQSSAEDWLETLRAHCLGVYTLEDGKYQLRINKPIPTSGYTKERYSEFHDYTNNLRPNVVPGSIRWGRKKRSELFNEVEIRYTDLQNNFGEGTVVKSRAAVTNGTELARRATYQLPGLFDSSIAGRLATQMLNLAWDDAWFEWEADRSALKTMPWDVVQLTGGGLINQDVRVQSVTATGNGFTIRGAEYNPNSYSDTIVQADAPLVGGTIGVVNASDLNPPTLLGIAEDVDEPQPGVFIPKLTVTFQPNMTPSYGGTQIKLQVGAAERVIGTFYYSPVTFPVPEGPGKAVTVKATTVHKSGVPGSTSITLGYTMYDPNAPEPVGEIFSSAGLAWWTKPQGRATLSTVATAWTSSGTTTFNNAAMNDGNTGTVAAVFNSAVAGWIKLDAGSAQAIREFEIFYMDDTSKPPLGVEWSDDNVNWTGSYSVTEPTSTKRVISLDATAGAHRYWRLSKGATAYTARISEIRPRLYTGSTYPYVKGYRLTGFVPGSAGEKYVKDITFTPTQTLNPINLGDFTYSWESPPDPIWGVSTSGGSFTEVTVQTISSTNAIADGRKLTQASMWSAALAGNAPQQPWVPQGSTDLNVTAVANPNVNITDDGARNLVRVTGGVANWTIGGLTAGQPGRMVTLLNATTFEGAILHEDASSAAANRFALPDSINATLPPGAAATLVYDDVADRWRRMDNQSSAIDRVRKLTGSWGAFDVKGVSNGYSGIHFPDAGGRTLMMSSGVQGVHTGSAWSWYFQNGVLTAGTVPWGNVTNKPNLLPNDGTYGSFKATGNTNSWPGIWFSDAGSAGYFMWMAQYQGAYDTSVGWKWRFNNGTLDVGTVPGSAVSAPRNLWQNNSPVTAQEIGWRNFGNNHTVVENSGQNYRPNNADPDVEWAATYPTLMGFNGSSTYGVRVDRSRYADHLKGGATVPTPAATDNTTTVANTAWVKAYGGGMERVASMSPSVYSGGVDGCAATGYKPRGFLTSRAYSNTTTNTTIVNITGKGVLRFLSGGAYYSQGQGYLTLVIDGITLINDSALGYQSNHYGEAGFNTTFVGSVVMSHDPTAAEYYISAVPSDYGITFKSSLTIYARTSLSPYTCHVNYAYTLY